MGKPLTALFLLEEKMSRRLNGEGTVYLRKDGRWAGAYYIDKCKKRIYVYGKSSKEVLDKLKKKIEEYEQEKTIRSDFNDYLLQDWVKIYLETYKKNELKESTYGSYLSVYRNSIENSEIGRMMLSKIKPVNIQSYYNEKLKAGISVKSVWHIKSLIGSSLKQAVREGIIKDNPDEYTVLPKKKRYEPTILMPEEIKKITDNAKEDPLYPIIIIALYTGMRKGELMALQWENVDFKNRQIFVKYNLCRVEHEKDINGMFHNVFKLDTPKSKKSMRYIPITDIALDALKIQKEWQIKNKEKYRDVYQENDFVFTEANGSMIRQRQFMDKYHAFLKEYGVSDCRFHDLRHSFASLMLEAGVSIKTLSDILGHSQISTSLDIYTHTYDSTKRIAVNKFNDIVMGNKEQLR